MPPEQKIHSIFQGNPFAHGRSVPKDGDPRAGGLAVDELYTPQVIKDHLDGGQECGVYPAWHNPDGTLVCAIGCCDIDTKEDAGGETYALATALKAMGVVPHIERSRSKGYHIWVFSDAIVFAAEMRRTLKVAYAAIELPAKEANPKSESLKPGQKGNYVRVPYFGGGSDGRNMFVKGWSATGPGEPVTLWEWLDGFDQSCYTPADTLRSWAKRWKEPERKHIMSVDMVDDDSLKQLVGRLPGDLLLFVKNGPQHDRSGGLVALGYKLRSQGYTVEEIYSILTVADQAWGGKFTSRQDGDRYLTEIVERVVQ